MKTFELLSKILERKGITNYMMSAEDNTVVVSFSVGKYNAKYDYQRMCGEVTVEDSFNGEELVRCDYHIELKDFINNVAYQATRTGITLRDMPTFDVFSDTL